MNTESLSRKIVFVAGLLGGLGVLIGAFGAHGLEDYLAGRSLAPELVIKRLGQFDVGARYHLVHAVAMLGLAQLTVVSDRAKAWAFVLMTAGIMLFSGSLYLLVITNTAWLGAITPLGGVSWIIAWFLIAIAAATAKPLPIDG